MNELINQFHFIRPWYLLAMLPALAACWALWRSQNMAQSWQRHISANLLPFLIDGEFVRKKLWPLLGLLAIWTLAVLALAGPTWQKLPVPVQRNASASVICWDLSPSMLAEDIKPSRLVKSRLKIIDLLNSKQDGQAGLIAYSGEAYVVTPLTDDFQTIINLLPALAPNTLPSVGSNPEMAVDEALKLLNDAGVIQGNIVLMSDGLTPDAMQYIADAMYKSPHTLTVWSIGTSEGAPIPLPQGGFAKDSAGNIVVAKINEPELQEFTRSIGAYLVPMLNNDSDVKTLITLTEPQQDQAQQSDKIVEQWFEFGQFVPLLLLPFCLLFFRRGLVFGLLLLPFFYSPPSLALTWKDLWQTQNQQAEAELRQGNEAAAMDFDNPARRGSELYKQGLYDEAAQQFASDDDAQGHYNLGTSLVQADDYAGAIDAFEKALEERPNFAQAEHNLEIAKKLQELAEQQQQSDQDQKQNDDSEQQNSDQQDNDQQNGEQQQQEQQQGQNSSGTSEQNASEQDGQQSSEENSQDSAQQAQQNSETAQNSSHNPFNTQSSQSDEQSQSSAAALAQEAQSSSAQGQSSSLATAAQMQDQMSDQAMSEEQQMLEQWLRKVPDDPSGLMRNKFRYQYLQRRDKLGQGYQSNQKSAEKRW